MKNIDTNIKSDFKILRDNKELVYLNSAATSLIPDEVVNFEMEYYMNNIPTLNRGFDVVGETSKEFTDSLNKVAKFINANNNEVIPTSGTTDALNKIASNIIDTLEDGDEIILGSFEHSSNILPWIGYAKSRNKNITIKWYELKDWKVDLEHLKTLVTDKTKVMAVTHQYNITGAVNNIKDIREVIGNNTILIVDAAQSISHINIDVKEMDCDYLVFGAHKAMGPNGLGFMYVKEEVLNNIEPFIYGGSMNKTYTKDSITYSDSINKFMAGTQNVPAVITFGKSIDYLNEIGLDNIDLHVKALKAETEKLLLTLPNVRVINEGVESGILFFEVNGVAGEDVAYQLSTQNIVVRSGSNCVKIVNDIYKQHKAVRASFHIYNDMNDVQKLYEAIRDGGDFLDALFNKREDSQLCK